VAVVVVTELVVQVDLEAVEKVVTHLELIHLYLLELQEQLTLVVVAELEVVEDHEEVMVLMVVQVL
jgi:hypothetical protein|tara:strand:- start:74 stop:271 length:198 start_codon:yes stop_codon:yes gene_type:complete